MADDVTKKRGPGPTRHPAEVRRRLLREAAREVVLRVGVAGASAREIAAAADVSLGTFTHHYSSVDEILNELLHRDTLQRFEAIKSRESSEATPRQRLHELCDVFLTDDSETAEYWILWLEYLTRAAHQTELRSFTAERWSRWERLVHSIVTEGIEIGEFPVDDAGAATRAVVALIDGYVAQNFWYGLDRDVQADRASLRKWLDVILGRDTC